MKKFIAGILFVVIAVASFNLLKPKAVGKISYIQSNGIVDKSKDKEVKIMEVRKNSDDDFEFKINFKWKKLKDFTTKDENLTITIITNDGYEFVVYNNSLKIGTANEMTVGLDNSVSYDKTIPNLNGNVEIKVKKMK